MFAQCRRGCEMHASDWNLERLCELSPVLASLDVCIGVVWIKILSLMPWDVAAGGNIPTATDFPSSSNSLATFRHLSLCVLVNSKSRRDAEGSATYRLEYVLVDTFVTERLEMLLKPRRFSCAGTSTEDDEFKIVLSGKGYGTCVMSTHRQSL